MNDKALVYRLLLVIAGSCVSTLNLVIGSTLNGKRRAEMSAYAQALHDELVGIVEELGVVG